MVTGKLPGWKTLNKRVPKGPHSQKLFGAPMAASAAVRKAAGLRPDNCCTLLIFTAEFAGIGVGPRLLRWSTPNFEGKGGDPGKKAFAGMQTSGCVCSCASVSVCERHTPKSAGAIVGMP